MVIGWRDMVRIVTNPGSNLPASAIARFDVYVLPQQIVVDGVHHDTRADVSHATIDAWVRGAREHPFVLGTSATEFVDVFLAVARETREILAIMTSREIIGSYTAAVAASRTLATLGGHDRLRVEVVDTRSTDLGAGLCAILAGESARAGRSLSQTVHAVHRFAEDGVMMLTVETLDNLVKGGRASFLRGWLANLLRVRPLLSFVDGQVAAVGRFSTSEHPPTVLADALVAKVGARRRVWAAVVHGGRPEAARELAERLRAKLDVALMLERPLSPSIYLHCGPGALGAFVYPIDNLSWTPTAPELP